MCVVREMGMFRIFAHVPQRPKTGKKNTPNVQVWARLALTKDKTGTPKTVAAPNVYDFLCQIDKIVSNVIFMTIFLIRLHLCQWITNTTSWMSPFLSRFVSTSATLRCCRKIHYCYYHRNKFRVCAAGAMPQCIYFQELFRTTQSPNCDYL